MPVVTLNVGSTELGRTAGGLTCLQWSDNGRSLFVGTESGRVLVVEMKAELVEIREEGYAMMNRLVEELVQELNSALFCVCWRLGEERNSLVERGELQHRKKEEVGWLMISNRISRLEMEPAQPIEGSKRKRPANVILLLSGSDL